MEKKHKKKNMVMTNEDIVRSWKEAKDRRAQIKILAELNVCSQEYIIEILKEGGVDPRALPRRRKQAAVGSAAEAASSAEMVNAATSVAAVKAEGEGSREEGIKSCSSGIVEEALHLLRRQLVEQCREFKEEYEAMMAKFAEKISAIDLMLCGQVCDDKEVSA